MYSKIIKHFILAVFVAFFATEAYTQTFTPKQQSFCDSIVMFLKIEGFVPTVKEHCIYFKKEGQTYWLNLANNEEEPYFVSFHHLNLLINGLDTLSVFKACNYANSTTRNCITSFDGSIITFRVDNFYSDINELTNHFYWNIKVLDAAWEKVNNSFDVVPFATNNVSIVNSYTKNISMSINGDDIVKKEKVKSFHAELDITTDNTFCCDLFIKLYNPLGNLQQSESSPDGYSWKERLVLRPGRNKYKLKDIDKQSKKLGKKVNIKWNYIITLTK